MSVIAVANLKEIAEALGFALDESAHYFDTELGRVVTISNELLRAAEDEDEEDIDMPSWQDGEWDIAQSIVATDRYLPLPTRFDVHEWAIMQEFAASAEEPALREELLRALQGAGAYRQFKNVLRRRNREQQWFTWKDNALRQIASDWCMANGIRWE